MVISKELFNNS